MTPRAQPTPLPPRAPCGGAAPRPRGRLARERASRDCARRCARGHAAEAKGCSARSSDACGVAGVVAAEDAAAVSSIGSESTSAPPILRVTRDRISPPARARSPRTRRPSAWRARARRTRARSRSGTASSRGASSKHGSAPGASPRTAQHSSARRAPRHARAASMQLRQTFSVTQSGSRRSRGTGGTTRTLGAKAGSARAILSEWSRERSRRSARARAHARDPEPAPPARIQSSAPSTLPPSAHEPASSLPQFSIAWIESDIGGERSAALDEPSRCSARGVEARRVVESGADERVLGRRDVLVESLVSPSVAPLAKSTRAAELRAAHALADERDGPRVAGAPTAGAASERSAAIARSSVERRPCARTRAARGVH